MADRVALTLHEGNDETLLLTIVREVDTDDLTTITALELFLKYDSCDADDAVTTLELTTGSGITITSQTAAQILATAVIPATALSGSFDRFWRVDGLVGSARRTAMYGPVTVVNL